MSEIKLSELEFTWRLDSEYYKKSFLKYENVIQHKGGIPLETIANFLIGPFGSAFKTENYTDDKTYRYIRGKDVKPLILLNNDNVYMPREDFIRLKKYALRENDILVSVVGTLGNAALVTKEDLPAIFSCKSTVLRTNLINPAYLLAYINSKYGRDLLLRKERGAIQKGLNLDDLKSLVVYIPSDNFQRKINDIFFLSLKKREGSKTAYATAENLLLDALGLNANTLAELQKPPKTVNANVKSFSNSFLSSGRLDAEFYQTKYDRFFEELYSVAEAKKWPVLTIRDMSGSLKYGSSTQLEYIEEGVPFLRIADLNKNRFEKNSLKYISYAAAEEETSASVQTDDVLISRSGTLGLTVAIPEFLNNAIFGSYFIRIRPNKTIVDPEYLALYMNSIAGKMQVEQQNTGGIQTNLTIPVIEEMKIVCPALPIQKQLVLQMHTGVGLEFESQQLLDLAKRAVEIAIEEGEEQALELISLHLNEPSAT